MKQNNLFVVTNSSIINNFYHNIFIILLILIYSAFFAISAGAAQFIESSDGAEISATISLSELNRIRVEGGKIDGIRISKGILEYSRDEKSGDIFINLLKRNKRPVNIFLTSDSGSTFKLLLIPKDIPAEQIFLIERVVKNGIKVFDNYQDQLTSFYKNLYDGITPKDYKVSNHKFSSLFNSLPIGKNTHDLKIALKSSYIPTKPNNFRGDIYEIRNKSKFSQILNPQNFYQEGIRGIKFDTYLLNPKEVTKMYIISIAG
jgi:type-F conjugative transfer system secretin TraK